MGTLIGSYIIIDILGEGGMGRVYRAFDRRLKRPVALKVLRRDLGARQQHRLLREAQAMAQLSHPNVVQVHEVGEQQGRSYIVMELVEGRTLRQWQHKSPRPDWRACVEVYLQAGVALMAAHERDLVHRDFKPGNAIIDEQGRVRVLDFGLVRSATDPSADEEDDDGAISQPRPEQSQQWVSERLTQTGVVLGTPAYMAPEQMCGDGVDARGDQFSFCVSLWEAVHGIRPFAGRGSELEAAIRRGRLVPVPPEVRVPTKLEAVLRRGLAAEPDERWPSMGVLLDELRRVAAPRRRRGMVVGAGLLAVGVGLGVTRTLEWLHRCSGARTQLEGVWDDARKQRVKAVLLGTGLSYAPGTWDRVEPRLDAYADAWAAEHTDACEATRTRGEQSEQEMSLRMGCLRQRRQYLRATVGELERADATVVENAVQAVTSLPGLERCRDLEALRAEVAPPEDPAVAQQVDELDERLVVVMARDKAGKYEDALRLADAVVEEGRGLDYEPLMVRAWSRQGHLRAQVGDYEGAVKVLRKAYGGAVAHTMMADAADASVALVDVLGGRLARYEEARGWVEHAEPLSRAVGTDEARARYLNSLGGMAFLQAEYEDAREIFEQVLAIQRELLDPDHPNLARSLNNLGLVVASQAEYEEAREIFERALAIRERALGPDHPEVASSLQSLGNLARSRAEYEDAREIFERALAIRERALGLDHPDVAHILNELGNVAALRGEYEGARDRYERALAILESVLGPDHLNVVPTIDNLGNVTRSQGEYEDARGLYERALEIKEKALGTDHPDVAITLNNLGILATLQGEYEVAGASHERALTIWKNALGPDHPHVAFSLNNLGDVAALEGEYEDARDLYERALANREKALGPDHPLVAYPLTGLGEVLLALARPADAVPVLERALTIRTTHGVGPAKVATTRFALARAVWSAPMAQGPERSRAHALAQQARTTYAALGDTKQGELTKVQAWLAQHHVP